MKTCTICKLEKPCDDFNKKSSAKDGLQNKCRLCSRERSRAYYALNKEKHVAAVRVNTQKYMNRNRTWIGNYLLNNPCIDCGNSDLRVLDFDHRPGTIKVNDVTILARNCYPLSIVIAEVEKCDVRCRNCHQIITFERLGGTWREAFLQNGSLV